MSTLMRLLGWLLMLPLLVTVVPAVVLGIIVPLAFELAELVAMALEAMAR